MPEPGLERDLNFERRGDLRRAFFVPKTQTNACRSEVAPNDMQENKDLKHVATRLTRP